MARDKAQIRLRIYDGTRKPFAERQTVLLRVHNGQTTDAVTKTLNTKSLVEGEVILNVKFFNNFADDYAILVSADGYSDTGFFPVKVSLDDTRDLSLMLVPDDPAFEFDPWDALNEKHRTIADFLSLKPIGGGAKTNYEAHVEDDPLEMACLLNLATAMSQIFLADGTPISYFRSVDWKSLGADRFFGYAHSGLVTQVKAAVPKKLFAPELDPAFFHGDATSSFKEIRFGEANVQLTFHENDKKQINGDPCIRVETDIDYYKDPGAHALFEVIFNHITSSVTDPVQVYQLRWMAGKQAGLPEFSPSFVLVE